jgi:hypothetical protein
MIIVNASQKYLDQIESPWKLKLYFLAKLPMALLAGINIKSINEKEATVTMKYCYLNTNPFKSIYFACLQMAAEFSTGILCMQYLNDLPVKVSILIIENKALFTKKAVGKISFRSNDGMKIRDAIQESINTGEGRTVNVLSVGTDEKGDKIGDFYFTWSFKPKSRSKE